MRARTRASTEARTKAKTKTKTKAREGERENNENDDDKGACIARVIVMLIDGPKRRSGTLVPAATAFVVSLALLLLFISFFRFSFLFFSFYFFSFFSFIAALINLLSAHARYSEFPTPTPMSQRPRTSTSRKTAQTEVASQRVTRSTTVGARENAEDQARQSQAPNEPEPRRTCCFTKNMLGC